MNTAFQLILYYRKYQYLCSSLIFYRCTDTRGCTYQEPYAVKRYRSHRREALFLWGVGARECNIEITPQKYCHDIAAMFLPVAV